MSNPLHFYSARDPWTVVVCDDGGLIVCTKGDVICHSDRNHGRDDPADLALFPLIAAAPDLLAACKLCMESNGDYITMMAAAIAKAEGKS